MDLLRNNSSSICILFYTYTIVIPSKHNSSNVRSWAVETLEATWKSYDDFMQPKFGSGKEEHHASMESPCKGNDDLGGDPFSSEP